MTIDSQETWKKASALFAELADLDESARLERLHTVDPDLRSTVESLLAADSVANEQLEKFETRLSSVVRRNTASDLDSLDPLRLTGTTFAHFHVVEYLASGGMGVVYRAEDIRLKRMVALKFPLPHYQLNQGMKERFMREAQAAGALEHVNLCTVHEVGDSEYGPFIAMPYYAGVTLKQRLETGDTFAVDEALEVAGQIAAGLAHAHAAGIVHRDLKPGNVMLLPDGTVKVLDFGLAKAADISQTKSGVTLGTVSYMAPEQIRGEKVDARADLWSLGVLLYEMFTGQRPFAGEHEASIAHAILNRDPVPPAALRNDLPRSAHDLVRSLLEKDRSDRYPEARAVAADISAIRLGKALVFKPRTRPHAVRWILKRRMPIAATVIVAVVVAAASWPRLSAGLNKPTNSPEAYQFYLQGRDYEKRGPMAAAESLYLRALSLDSGFALARARLAVVFAQCQAGGSRDCYRRGLEDSRLNRPEAIRLEAEKALRIKPGLADAHFAMGLYWEKSEQPARALAEYERAKRGLGKTGELHAAIGRAYRAQGQWSSAIEEFERAIALDPRDSDSMADLATTYSRLRRYEESARLWNRSLALTPDAYQGHLIKGNMYLRWLGAVDSLEATYRRLPAEQQRRAINTGVLIARIRNKPADALAAIEAAPARIAGDPLEYNSKALLRAAVYTDMGDTTRARINADSARIVLERLVATRPNDFATHAALGVAYARLGREADAVREAGRTMSAMPPSRTLVLGTTAMRRAAEIYAHLPGHHDRAIQLLDSLMRMPAGREVSAAFLRVDPAWNPLRSNPGFQDLIKRYSR